jgi:hypothetical protein
MRTVDRFWIINAISLVVVSGGMYFDFFSRTSTIRAVRGLVAVAGFLSLFDQLLRYREDLGLNAFRALTVTAIIQAFLGHSPGRLLVGEFILVLGMAFLMFVRSLPEGGVNHGYRTSNDLR